jgi:hypothetical protein
LSAYDTAAAYRRSGARLDDHLATCPTCSVGVACPDGDDKATNEYRAFREWQRDDPTKPRTAYLDRS